MAMNALPYREAIAKGSNPPISPFRKGGLGMVGAGAPAYPFVVNPSNHKRPFDRLRANELNSPLQFYLTSKA